MPVVEGDLVYVCRNDHDMYGKYLTVLNPKGSVAFREFIGNHIVAIDDDHKEHILRDGDYIESAKMPNIKNEIAVNDWIKLKSTKGNNFYKVVEVHDSGVSFFDSYGNKISVVYEDVIKVGQDELIRCIQNLQVDIDKLKKFIIEVGNIVSTDIKEGINRILSN